MTETKLSKNEQGIIKRRLLENREPFGKFLQLLLRWGFNQSIDISHIENIRQQIDKNEEALTEMIEGITEDQLESLRTIVAYLWERSYSGDVFNKSTLLKLMREQLNLRQDDIQRGIAVGITTGITTGRAAERAERIASERAVANRMVEQGKFTREQMEDFLREMENYKKDS
ncbi:MAG: hypothetical protein ABFS56_10730 [Pseudomonadota bacterium]